MSVAGKRFTKCVVRISPLRHNTGINTNTDAQIEAFMQGAKAKYTDRSQIGEDELWKTYSKQKIRRNCSKQRKQAAEATFRHMYKQVFQTNLAVHGALQNLNSDAKLQAIKTQASTRSSPRNKVTHRIFSDSRLETDTEDKKNSPGMNKVPKIHSKIQNTKKSRKDSELKNSENVLQSSFVESDTTSHEMQPSVGLERLNVRLSRKTEYKGTPFLKSVQGTSPKSKIGFLEDSERPTRVTRNSAARNTGSIDDKHDERALPERMTRSSQEEHLMQPKSSGDKSLTSAKRKTRAIIDQAIPATSKGSIVEEKEVVTSTPTRRTVKNVAGTENQSAKRAVAEAEIDLSADGKPRKRMKHLDSNKSEVVLQISTRSSPKKKPGNLTNESERRLTRASSSMIVSNVPDRIKNVEIQRASKNRDSDADADSEGEDNVPKVKKSSKKTLEQEKEVDQRSASQSSTQKSFYGDKTSNKKEKVQSSKRKKLSASNNDNDDQARRSSPRRKSHAKENETTGEKRSFHGKKLFDSSDDESDSESHTSKVEDADYTARLKHFRTSRMQSRNLRSSRKEGNNSMTRSARKTPALKTVVSSSEEFLGEVDKSISSPKHPAKEERTKILHKQKQSPMKEDKSNGQYDSDNEGDGSQSSAISLNKYPRHTRSSVTQQLASQNSVTPREKALRRIVSSKSHGDNAGNSGPSEVIPKEAQQRKRKDAKTSDESGASNGSMQARKIYPFRSSRADSRRYSSGTSERKSARKVALDALASQQRKITSRQFESDEQEMRSDIVMKTSNKVDHGTQVNMLESSDDTCTDGDDEANQLESTAKTSKLKHKSNEKQKTNVKKLSGLKSHNKMSNENDDYFPTSSSDDSEDEYVDVNDNRRLMRKSQSSISSDTSSESDGEDDNTLRSSRSTALKGNQEDVGNETKQIVLRQRKPKNLDVSESEKSQKSGRILRRSHKSYHTTNNISDSSEEIFTDSDDGTIPYKSPGKRRTLNKKSNDQEDVNRSIKIKSNDKIGSEDEKEHSSTSSGNDIEVEQHATTSKHPRKRSGKSKSFRAQIASSESESEGGNDDASKELKTTKSDNDETSEDDSEQIVLRKRQSRKSDVVETIESTKYSRMLRNTPQRSGQITKMYVTESSEDALSESDDDIKAPTLKPKSDKEVEQNLCSEVKSSESIADEDKNDRPTSPSCNIVTDLNVASPECASQTRELSKSPRIHITRCDTDNCNVRNTRQASGEIEQKSTDNDDGMQIGRKRQVRKSEDSEAVDGNKYTGILRKRQPRVDRNDNNDLSESSDDSLTDIEDQTDEKEISSRKKKSKEDLANGSANDLTTAMSRYSNERRRKLSKLQKLGGKTNEHQEPDNDDDSSNKVVPGDSDMAVDNEDELNPSPKADIDTTVLKNKSPTKSTRKQILPLDSDDEATETRQAEIQNYPLRSKKMRSVSPIAPIEMDVDDACESTLAANDKIERPAAKSSTQIAADKVIVSSKRRLGIKDILDQFAESSSDDESQVMKNTIKRKTNVITEDNDSQCEEPEAIPQLVPIVADIRDEDPQGLSAGHGKPTSPVTPLKDKGDTFFPCLTDDDEQAAQASVVVESDDDDNETIGAICRFLNVNEPSVSPPVPLLTHKIPDVKFIESTDVHPSLGSDAQPAAQPPCDDIPKVLVAENDPEAANITMDLKCVDADALVQEDVGTGPNNAESNVAKSSETSSKRADGSKMYDEEEYVAPSQDSCPRKIKIILEKIDDVPNSPTHIDTVTIDDSDADTEIFPLESHLKSLEAGPSGESSSCLVPEHVAEDTSLVGSDRDNYTKTAEDNECRISELKIGEEVQCESGECSQEGQESTKSSAGDLFALDDDWDSCSKDSMSNKNLDKGLDNSAGTSSTTRIAHSESLQKLENDEEKEMQRLKKLKRYVRETGVNISFASLFHENDTTLQKTKKLVKVLRDNGVQGQPTFLKCRAIREQRESKKEVGRQDKVDVLDADPAVGTHIPDRIYASSGVFRATPIKKQ